jgi:hypothetical protein
MTPAPDTPLRVVESSDALAEAAAPPPAASAARGQPVTVALTVPIEAHGETRTTLTFRVPKVEDFEACDLFGNNRTTRTFSDFIVRLAGIPRSSVLQLAPIDYAACVKAAGSFLETQAETS